jgi:hypothetical protein
MGTVLIRLYSISKDAILLYFDRMNLCVLCKGKANVWRRHSLLIGGGLGLQFWRCHFLFIGGWRGDVHCVRVGLHIWRFHFLFIGGRRGDVYSVRMGLHLWRFHFLFIGGWRGDVHCVRVGLHLWRCHFPFGPAQKSNGILQRGTITRKAC